MAAYV